MSDRRARLARRNEKIRADYSATYAKGLRHEKVLEQLSEKWALAQDTIERIVCASGIYSEF